MLYLNNCNFRDDDNIYIPFRKGPGPSPNPAGEIPESGGEKSTIENPLALPPSYNNYNLRVHYSSSWPESINLYFFYPLILMVV